MPLLNEESAFFPVSKITAHYDQDPAPSLMSESSGWMEGWLTY